MVLVKKPFEQHPHDLIKNVNWHGNFCTEINKLINDSYDIVRKEAEDDGIPDLADESYLYECFNENVKFDLAIDNWQVLKYFLALFRIKIYRNMIGEWCFTTNDVDMYNHFRMIDTNKSGRCSYKKLLFNNGTIPYLNEYNHTRLLKCYGLQLAEPNGIVYDFSYLDVFGVEFAMIEGVERTARGLNVSRTAANNFFTAKHRYYRDLDLCYIGWYDIFNEPGVLTAKNI